MATKDIRYGLGQIVSSDGILTWLAYPVFLDLLAAVIQWSCRESNPSRDLRKCGLTCVGLREGTADSARVPGNYAGVVGESNMSTLLAVVPRVFAGLPLICEQLPGDRAKPHIGGRATLSDCDRPAGRTR
jgi:hypothetical protein